MEIEKTRQIEISHRTQMSYCLSGLWGRNRKEMTNCYTSKNSKCPIVYQDCGVEIEKRRQIVIPHRTQNVLSFIRIEG